LLERDGIVASAAELVSRVGSGGAGALFLVGEAGLGKTSVIGQACRRAAEAGLTVGVGRGHPMESGLPYGVLVQAFDGLGARELLAEDTVDSRSAADWPARYYQVLRWLRDRAGDRVFLAIDDLHWADADSVALVSFLCRRMDQVPFGLIASLRPWPAMARDTAAQLMHEGHGNVLRLLPLTEQAAGTLLQARLGRQVPADARQRAFELSAGNPLLLEQLAVAMGKGTDVSAADIGPAASGQGVLLSRFAGLTGAGMRCAQAAAVLGSGFLPAVAAEIAGLAGADADAAIEALARTGLIEQRPGAAAEFVHPLFRQALYDELPGRSLPCTLAGWTDRPPSMPFRVTCPETRRRSPCLRQQAGRPAGRAPWPRLSGGWTRQRRWPGTGPASGSSWIRLTRTLSPAARGSPPTRIRRC